MKRYSYILFFLAVLSSKQVYAEEVTPVYAINGSIDLSSRDLRNSGSLSLNGHWKFFPNEFFTLKDIKKDEQKFKIVNLPTPWNSKRHHKEPHSRYGYATYALKIVVGKKNKGVRLAIKPDFIASSYEVEVDGEVIGENGKLSKSVDSGSVSFQRKFFSFEAPSDEFYLLIRVANYFHIKAGIWSTILIGNAEQIRQTRQINIFFEILFFGGLLIMGFYHFFLYFFRREERSNLWISVCFVTISSLSLFRGERVIYDLISSEYHTLLYRLDFAIIYFFTPSYILYHLYLFPKEYPQKTGKIILFGSFLFPLIPFIPGVWFMEMGIVVQSFSIFIFGMIFYTSYKALKNKRDGSKIYFYGLVVVLFSLILNALRVNSLVEQGFFAQFDLLPIGITTYLFTQSIIVARKFSNSFGEVKRLSKNLQLQSKVLRKKNEELESLDKLKDEFLANVAHELRTPLHGILAMSDSISRRVPEESKKWINTDLHTIKESGERLSHLIDDLLDHSKLKSKVLQLKKNLVSLPTILKTILTLNDYRLAANVEFLNLIPSNFPLFYADKNRLIQVIHNLVGNATKFTKTGVIVIDAEEEGDFLRIFVADTGIGIDEKDQERIFDTYTQVEGGGEIYQGGTGLGLSIAKKLVELHEGDIQVQSVKDVGSCFSFTVKTTFQENPAQLEEFPSDFIPKTNTEIDPPLSNVFKIIAIDDDKLNLTVIEKQLDFPEFEVVVTNSARDGIRLILEQRDFDLVLLDIMMPEMDGFEVCRVIREDFGPLDLPIIFLTALNKENALDKSLGLKGNDYIEKPFNQFELLARVNNQLNLGLISNRLSIQNDFSVEFTEKFKGVEFLFNVLSDFLTKDKKLESVTIFADGQVLGVDRDFSQIEEIYRELRDQRELKAEEKSLEGYYLFSLEETTTNKIELLVKGKGELDSSTLDFVRSLTSLTSSLSHNISSIILDSDLLHSLYEITFNIKNIVLIKSQSRFCEVVYKNGKSSVVPIFISVITMYYYGFKNLMQIKRNLIVNLDYVDFCYKGTKGNYLLKMKGESQAISPNYLENIKKYHPQLFQKSKK